MDVVKQGYVRVKSKRLSLWKKRWIILRRASSKGPVRMEKYCDERSSRNISHHPKTLLLTNVTNVCRLSSTVRVHSFAITFDHDPESRWFSCDSDLEADCWVKLLIQECLLPQPGIATGEPDVLSPGIQKELQEQFHVYLMPNPKLDAFGECLLQVTPENIYLWDVSNSKLKLVFWPLTALRRYGSDPTKFTFEAGRHCATGEGMFVFHTLVGEQIYRKVHQATLAIAEAHHRSKRPGHLSIGHSCTPHPVTPTSPIPPIGITSICDNSLTAIHPVQDNSTVHPHYNISSTSPEPCTPSILTPSHVHHRSRPDVFTFPDIQTAPAFRIAKEEEISIESGHYAHTSSHYSPTAQSSQTSTTITLLADIDDSQAVTV